MVEAPGVVLRPQQQLTEQAQRRPPDWVAYTDGSEDLGKAGWAYAVLIGGDAIGDEGASRASEGYGPVVTSAAHPAYLGARKHTNNTAELTALAELLRALLSSSPQRAGSRGVVRTDSEYAAACMMGRVTPKTNRQLPRRNKSRGRCFGCLPNCNVALKLSRKFPRDDYFWVPFGLRNKRSDMFWAFSGHIGSLQQRRELRDY